VSVRAAGFVLGLAEHQVRYLVHVGRLQRRAVHHGRLQVTVDSLRSEIDRRGGPERELRHLVLDAVAEARLDARRLPFPTKRGAQPTSLCQAIAELGQRQNTP
jgi:hypothetical protein